MEGFGDVIEAIIPDAIKPKDCKKCQERKKALNNKFPLPKPISRILKRSKRK
jgi:hypothetical protein